MIDENFNIRLEHKPHLSYPWQIRVKRLSGKWIVVDAKKTEVEAQRVKDRIIADRMRGESA